MQTQRRAVQLRHQQCAVDTLQVILAHKYVVSKDAWELSRVCAQLYSHPMSKRFQQSGEVGRAFLRNMSVNELEGAKWLYETFSFTTFDLRSQPFFRYRVEIVCRNGWLPMMQWLHEVLNFTIEDFNVHNALYENCEKGHLQTARWLEEIFHLTEDGNRLEQCVAKRAFCRSCANGHTSCAQWIWETFHPSQWQRQDMFTYRYAFRLACNNGHLLTARWLYETFQPRLCSNSLGNRMVFRTACLNGHLHVAQWLYAELRPRLFRRDTDVFPRRAYRRYPPEVHRWLHELFLLTYVIK